MDQDSTKSSDKRNWRERLGIGGATGASQAKELPRISDDYQGPQSKPVVSQARPAGARPAAVKPAPMAPRPANRSVAPVAPEKLAERLRSQRDAQAKLAEQRVQVARQRGEQLPTNITDRPVSSLAPKTASGNPGKPKFTFAEDEQNLAAAQPKAPVSQPPLQPPRQPLGASPSAPAFQPRYPAQGGFGSSAGQGTLRPGLPPSGYSPPPYPGYRPFEQSSGYVPPPRGVNAGIGSPPPNGYASQPRLNVPGKSGYTAGQDYAGYTAPPGIAPDPRFNPPRSGRMPPPRSPAAQYDDTMPEDGYYPEQMPPPRAGRRSAADYQQAYRDMEQGYDEQPTRSRGPWILLGLLLLALAVAMAGVWYYQTTIKPQIDASTTGAQVPVVEAPAGQTTAPPEPPAAEASATDAGGKKQIYDRIVGDQEDLNGQLAPTEEVPIDPPAQESLTSEPTVNPAAASPSTAPSGSDDSAPLPIPPPPGDSNSQGSLPLDPEYNSAQQASPAADTSQASAASEIVPAATPPAPGETAEADAITGQVESETIEPSLAPQPKPVIPVKKKVAAKTNGSATLGASPVVLVPPAEDAAPPADGLYGTEETVASTAPVSAAPVKKKKKTLADLFNSSTEENSAQFTSTVEVPQPVKKAQAPIPAAPKPAAPLPAEIQVASAPGYVAQLASFRTKQEANTEFGRLKSKHGGILQGTTPIIREAVVAGSTRYRLAVGSFASKDAASSICSQLLAAGERDCLVKQQ
jgi:hypothetical protein